jgi:hypothetical protein
MSPDAAGDRPAPRRNWYAVELGSTLVAALYVSVIVCLAAHMYYRRQLSLLDRPETSASLICPDETLTEEIRR